MRARKLRGAEKYPAALSARGPDTPDERAYFASQTSKERGTGELRWIGMYLRTRPGVVGASAEVYSWLMSAFFHDPEKRREIADDCLELARAALREAAGR